MQILDIIENSGFSSHLAEMLKVLGHPMRLRLVALLAEGEETNVNAIAERLGTNQAIISQHLRILRMRRLVEVDRKNGFAHYRLAEPKLIELLNCLKGCPC